MSGYFKTAMLLAALTAVFMGVGWMIGGTGGMAVAFVVALGMNAMAYWYSDKMVLSHYRAQPVTQEACPWLYDMAADLAARGGLPMPALYVIENAQPNAFATGRDPDHAAVAVTTGIMSVLSREELAGVIAHELAHIKNRDTLIMTVTATLAGALSMLANFAFFFGGNRNNGIGMVGTILVAILAPVAASLVQMAISRAREYEADRIGAEICGQPKALAEALEKIAAGAARIDNVQAEDNPASAHMFIINPLHVHAIDGLFSTHPPTEERIRRLLSMSYNPWARAAA